MNPPKSNSKHSLPHNNDAQSACVFELIEQLCDLKPQEFDAYRELDLAEAGILPENFKLSIVIPVFNEENTIATVIGRLSAIPIEKELVIVDDCSSDRTVELLERFGEIDNIHVFYKRQNEGKGAALRTAFSHASGDIIVVQDADLEYDPKDIPKLLVPLLNDEADVVYGSRFLPLAENGQNEEHQDKSWIHRMGNGVLTWASNVVNGTELTDMETCYKAFRRDVLNDLALKQDRFGIEPELTAKLARRGFRFTEVPISYNARGWDEGKKIGVKDLFQAFYCIGRYGFCD